MNQYIAQILQEVHKKEGKFTALLHSGNNWQNDWTIELKKTLTKIGQSHGFFVNTGSFRAVGADDGEWLFDMVWSRLFESGPKTLTTKVVLIVESEISKRGFGALKEDFDKFMFAPKALKLFVAIDKGDGVIQEFQKYAQNQVNHNEDLNWGDRVYFLVWREDLKPKPPVFELHEIIKN